MGLALQLQVLGSSRPHFLPRELLLALQNPDQECPPGRLSQRFSGMRCLLHALLSQRQLFLRL